MPTLDVLTPLRHGRFIRGDVVAGILRQGVDLRWLVDAREDPPVGDGEHALLDAVSVGPFWRNHKLYMARILAKRNRLVQRSAGEHIYHADADVILPQRPILPAMLAAMARHRRLGAVGAVYAVDWPHARYHVGAGSMLMRRDDAVRMLPLRGAPCECSYIRVRLMEQGKDTVPLTAAHAHQWKRTLLEGDNPVHEHAEDRCPLCDQIRNPEHDYVDVRWQVDADGHLDIGALRDLVAAHGDRFRLYLEHLAETSPAGGTGPPRR